MTDRGTRVRYTNKSTASARYKRAGAAVKSRQAPRPDCGGSGLTVAEKAQYRARVVLMFATRTTEGGQRDGSHSRLAPPDDVGGTGPGGLRLPHRRARALQRQEDGAVRRQGADLPPLLRKSPRRREHDPDDLPVSPGRRDGPPGRESDQAAQPVRSGRLDRLLGRPALGQRHRLRDGAALRDRAAALRAPVRHRVRVRRRDRAGPAGAVGRERGLGGACDPRRPRNHDLGARS